MNKIKNEIKCLTRLHELTGCLDDMMEFLHQEGLMTPEEIKAARSSSDVAKYMQAKLATLSKDNKLQLLEYDWSILPVEIIDVFIITDRTPKNFTFNR